MRAFLGSAVLGFAVLLVVIQFIRPARTNPPIVPGRTLEDAVFVPPAIEAILTRSCADCHSDRTGWPWYSQVAPVSWFLVDHVRGGRRHMNFSEWLRPGIGDPAQYTREKFHSACRQMQTRDMPLFSYLLLHPKARTSSGDIQAICRWADDVSLTP